jgi:hypothetical protein
MTIEDEIGLIEHFKDGALEKTIWAIERHLTETRADHAQVEEINQSHGVDSALIQAAAAVKRASAQIDVVIHAAGILFALPHILRPGEKVECLSLGAGNAGSRFDLETGQRIAEFKFIQWQARGNAIREKTLFQDFFKLVRHQTDKEKYLYLLNTDIPKRFLSGSRDALKVLGRDKAGDECTDRHGRPCRTVGEYFAAHRDEVHIENLAKLVPGFEVFLENLKER